MLNLKPNSLSLSLQRHFQLILERETVFFTSFCGPQKNHIILKVDSLATTNHTKKHNFTSSLPQQSVTKKTQKHQERNIKRENSKPKNKEKHKLLILINKMLLRGSISTPLPSSLRLNLTTRTTHPRNVTVSSQARLDYPLSVSDEALNSRGFTLRRSAEGLNLEQLNTVFVAVGFPRRDPDKIRLALEHTDSMVWVEQLKSKRAVAFARATGDGVFNAIIWDVVVDPSFQGIGLGKVVVERIIQDLLSRGISNIALYSEPRVLGFYRPLGFIADPDGIRGMVYSRKQRRK